MTHAPKFWADKLPEELRAYFWQLVNAPSGYAFGGETAYYLALEGKFRD